MNSLDVDQDDDEIKPGESLYTPEWKAATRKLPLGQRAVAQLTIALMCRDGWVDVPDDETIAKGIGTSIAEVRRKRRGLDALPAHTIAEQLKRVRRWPSFVIEEVLP